MTSIELTFGQSLMALCQESQSVGTQFARLNICDLWERLSPPVEWNRETVDKTYLGRATGIRNNNHILLSKIEAAEPSVGKENVRGFATSSQLRDYKQFQDRCRFKKKEKEYRRIRESNLKLHERLCGRYIRFSRPATISNRVLSHDYSENRRKYHLMRKMSGDSIGGFRMHKNLLFDNGRYRPDPSSFKCEERGNKTDIFGTSKYSSGKTSFGKERGSAVKSQANSHKSNLKSRQSSSKAFSNTGKSKKSSKSVKSNLSRRDSFKVLSIKTPRSSRNHSDLRDPIMTPKSTRSQRSQGSHRSIKSGTFFGGRAKTSETKKKERIDNFTAAEGMDRLTNMWRMNPSIIKYISANIEQQKPISSTCINMLEKKKKYEPLSKIKRFHSKESPSKQDQTPLRSILVKKEKALEGKKTTQYRKRYRNIENSMDARSYDQIQNTKIDDSISTIQGGKKWPSRGFASVLGNSRNKKASSYTYGFSGKSKMRTGTATTNVSPTYSKSTNTYI